MSFAFQYLHYTGFGVRPDKAENGVGYALKIDQLPHIINPIEAYLSKNYIPSEIIINKLILVSNFFFLYNCVTIVQLSRFTRIQQP